MPLMLGKKPATRTPKLLKFADFLDDTAQLPPLPTGDFGRDGLIKPGGWGMLANDQLGDCVIAGGLHETLLWNAEAGKVIRVNDACAVKNYSAITGYNPNDPSSDQGTDMEAAAKYRRTHGLVDADGHAHKIGAYVDLNPGNLTELWYATLLFDGVGIGVEFPSQWMDAFNAGKPWDKVRRPKMEGGHYITNPARRGGNATPVTWGQVQPLTPAGYVQFNDQTLAYATQEKLVNGKDGNGYNWTALRAALAKVATA